MSHAAKSVAEIVEDAIAGRFDIPEFQRGFVWSPDKVKNLLDSLCRNYPLGSVLSWQATDYDSQRGAAGTGTQRIWIVDGQQRTTALCLILGKKPYWFPAPEPWNKLFAKTSIHVNLKSDPEDLDLSLPNPIITKQKVWHSVRELLEVTAEAVPTKAIELMGKLEIATTDTVEMARLMAIINKLHSAIGRDVVVVTIDHDPVDVAEIFSRLNSAGTRVNDGDIALAMIAVRQEGWVRDELLPYLEDLNDRGFAFDPSFFIRTMVAIRKGTAKLKDIKRDFWEGNDDFRAGWERTKSAVNNVVRAIGEVGILTDSILPGRNALIPMFVLDDVHFKGDAPQLRQSIYWFLRAIQDGRYSSSATTIIARDVASIRTAESGTAALEALHSQLVSDLHFTVEEMLLRYDEHPFIGLMLYLAVFENRAEGWKTGHRLGFDRTDNSLNDGFRPEWHHFVPRGQLKKREPEPPSIEEINAIANIVILDEGSNRRFSSSPPYRYLEKYDVPDARVHQQFFPSRELWTSETYEQFINARAELLATALNAYVGRLKNNSLNL